MMCPIITIYKLDQRAGSRGIDIIDQSEAIIKPLSWQI